MTTAQQAAARTPDVLPGMTHRVVVDGNDILLCNVGGEIYAIEDVCTHDGGSLDQGEFEDNRIMCPRHGAYFDVKTGAALTLPAIVPLRTYSVRVQGDDIFIDV